MSTAVKYWTWAEIQTKMNNELDLNDETFIGASEMMEYANDAIRMAESKIQSLYEDYFLTRSPLTLVQGQDAYPLPSDCYAHKLRKIIYYNGTKIYEVKRIRDWKKFMTYRMGRYYTSSTILYGYFLANMSTANPQIILTPPSYESGQFGEIWYLRNANQITQDTDICDIPQFIDVVFDYIRERVFFKEQAGSPKHVAAKADLDETVEDMETTLAQMVADGENTIEPDLSLYEEMT